MKRFKKILVTTDTRLGDDTVVQAAAQIALHNKSSLTIVDVIPSLSWLGKLSVRDHEHVQELLRQEKMEKLAAYASPIREQGISVEIKLLEGRASVEVIREVQRGEHDLVMSVAKGHNSRHRGFFGQTARRLLRMCPCTVWLVAPNTKPQVTHVLACIDTSSENPLDAELNDKIYELATSISQHHSSQLSIIHAWSMQDEELLSTRLEPESVAEYARRDREHCVKLMDKFLRQHDSSGAEDNVHLIKGEAGAVLSAFCSERSVDLVVLGTVARSGVAGMFMGNTSERILDRIECSVLAVKPYRFKSPIRQDDGHDFV